MYKRFIQISLLLLGVLLTNSLFSQEHPVYEIEKRLIAGDKKALLEIAAYFDSDEQLCLNQPPHGLVKFEVKNIARGLAEGNCLFTKDKFSINTETGTKEFL